MKAHILVLLALAVAPGRGEELMLIGIDRKIDLKPTGIHKVPPRGDRVLLYDISATPGPLLKTRLDPDNSIFGPPTNLLITPDGKLGLVANSVNWVEVYGGWDAEPDTRLHVIDLSGETPKRTATVKTGAQPSGMGISADGKTVSKVGSVETGRFPEGVGFSRDERFLYVGDPADSQLSVFEVRGTALIPAGTLNLPGYPASLRTQVPWQVVEKP